MATQAIDNVLRRQGFELARQKRHRVWKRDDGDKTLTFVTPSTPSDRRWNDNALGDLARLLGLKRKDLLVSTVKEPRNEEPAIAFTPDHLEVSSVVTPAVVPLEATALVTPVGMTPVGTTLGPQKLTAKELRRLERESKEAAKKRASDEAQFVAAVCIFQHYIIGTAPDCDLASDFEMAVEMFCRDYVPVTISPHQGITSDEHDNPRVCWIVTIGLRNYLFDVTRRTSDYFGNTLLFRWERTPLALLTSHGDHIGLGIVRQDDSTCSMWTTFYQWMECVTEKKMGEHM